MSRKLQEELARWLRSEAAGAPAEQAETALRALLRQLPEPAPAAGFARRVMARLPAHALPVRDPFASLGLRFGLATVFLMLGTVLALLPALVPAASSLQAGAGITLLKTALLAFDQWLNGALAFWSWLLALAAAAARLLTSPAVATAIASCALLACATYRLCWQLIAQPRRVS